MIVELKGLSVRGVFALARNMGVETPRSLVRRADGVWRLRVELPARGGL